MLLNVYMLLFIEPWLNLQTDCIADPVSASSTDNYPEESITYTLESGDKFQHRASYWSSNGSDDPETPETLIYQLKDKFCVVTEINLHPFKGLLLQTFLLCGFLSLSTIWWITFCTQLIFICISQYTHQDLCGFVWVIRNLGMRWIRISWGHKNVLMTSLFGHTRQKFS